MDEPSHASEPDHAAPTTAALPYARPPQPWRQALLWTVVVVACGAALIWHDRNSHRAEQLAMAQQRLDGLHDTLDVNLRQLAALPSALSHLDNIQKFFDQVQLPGSERLTEADRPRARQQLVDQPVVQAMSRSLARTASSFEVSRLLLQDRHGTNVADSRLGVMVDGLGGNFRSRPYFTEAMRLGQGTQFLIGRYQSTAAFFFAARIEGTGSAPPRGVLLLVQEASSLQRFFSDAHYHLFVTDAAGVLVLGPAKETPLARTGLQGALSGNEDRLRRTYKLIPPDLGWSIDNVQVGQQNVLRVQRPDGSFMALSHPLGYGQLTAWTLIPMEGEAWRTGVGALLTGLVLVTGWGALILRHQRRVRLAQVQLARQTLDDMANALPLTVFRYVVPGRGRPPRFAFLGDGVHTLLGIAPESLREDPEHVWRLMMCPDQLPPTTRMEFSHTANGETRWLMSESRCRTTPDGSRIYNGYWADVSERKQAETRTQAVFNHAPLGFMFFDDQGVITHCNPAIVQMFGADHASAIEGLRPGLPPMSSPDFIADPAHQQRLDEAYQAMLARRIHRFEWTHTRFDGTPFDVDIVVIPFEHEGGRQVCAILQDITLRKRSEAALVAAQQAAEAAAEAKTRFLANMSHEIRTPMNAIMGMTHLALMDDQLPEKARHYLDKSHRAATNLLQILNDVLDVSKIESGKLELEYTDFQLETVISHMADVLGMRAEEKGLELLFTAPPDIPTALIGDPIRLGQVLINLGTNAIKFTERGEVLIGCEVQRESPSDVVLHFWVQDTGIGLSDAQIERIFLPFTQADSSTTRQYGGTGLGLTISRQLVELMRGHIWVQSRPGKGSTFHFTASFGVQSRPRTRRALTAEELQGKRLLLVDDNATAREVLGDMVRRLGVTVDTAEGGESALRRMHEAAARGEPHHILMTDWKMPGMDGIAFARQALSIPPELRPCVLLVTAFAREEALHAAQGVGLAGVLNKPVTPSTLMESLCLALSPAASMPQREHFSSRVLRQAQRQLAGARVLLVEDQPMNQELARDLLERAGISVVTANNGQEALQTLDAQGPFDGVLMDCQMPVMDGYTATERIRSRPEWHLLPVIAMTAGAMAADRERVLRSGMNDHITKPLELGQMFTILARWIHPAQPALTTAPPDPADAPEGPEASMPPAPTTPHLDVQDGLARCMGHWPLYERLLKGFARTQHDFPAQLARETTREGTLRAIHTFKGLAGNIGAAKLFACAQQLEQALADSPTERPLDASPVQAELQATESALQSVLTDIGLLLRQPTPQASPAPTIQPDAPALQAHWSRLATLITDADAQSRDALANVLQQWPELVRHADIKTLQQALERYDFDRAAQVLARCRQPVG